MSDKQIIGSFDAKTHFSEILRKVTEQGTEFIVTKHDKPVAIISPYSSKHKEDVQDAVNEFLSYCNKRKLKLNGLKLKEMSHEDHKH